MASECDKYEDSLMSTINHLLGFRSGAGGKLELQSGSRRRTPRRRTSLNIENINLEHAQKWEAGALLETASELKLISSAESTRIKGNLKITAQQVQSLPANQLSTSKKNVVQQPPPPLLSKGPSSFMPPRKVPTVPESSAGTYNQAQPVPGQSKQFSFRTRNADDMPPPSTTSHVRQIETPSSSLFTSVAVTGRGKGQTFPNNNRNVGPAEPGGRCSNNSLSNASLDTTASAALQGMFKTAAEQLAINDSIKGVKRTLPPASGSNVHVSGLRKPTKADTGRSVKSPSEEKPVSDNPEVNELMEHESMKNIDPKMVEAILNEVMQSASTAWTDIAGLDGVKEIIREIIIWPMLRPDIFTGLRASPRGILFFGPPGTGKTMFGRVIAAQSKSTFFNISASSLTSKWIGDGEKMVRALFQVARLKQPAVIFIDEIDSILTQRSDTEHESSRRLKTEFLIQFDGCATQTEDRILVIGVTNRPQELDEAARRRLVKRIYIPLPDSNGRKQLVKNLLHNFSAELTEDDYNSVAEMTEGYSGADMTSLCREAAYGPIREVGHLLQSLDPSQVRPMEMKDFVSAQRQVKSSVAKSDVALYEDWDEKFGCHI